MKKKTKPKKIDPNDRCPCESRKFYKNCCMSKDIKWHEDEAGNLYEVTPIPDEASEIIEKNFLEFENLFGRKMGPNEPVFFKMVYLRSLKSFRRNMIKTLDKVSGEVNPALAYATKKTGLFLNEFNRKYVTGKREKAFFDAVDEYYEKYQNKSDSEDVDYEFDTAGAYAPHNIYSDEFGDIKLAISHTLNHAFKKVRLPKGNFWKTRGIIFPLMVFLSKTLKSVDAVEELVENELGEDALNIVRSIYENYFQIHFCVSFPEEMGAILEAEDGIEKGTHEYCIRKNGKTDYDRIVDKQSGKVTSIRMTNFYIADKSPYPEDKIIYEKVNHHMSGYTHPDFRKAADFIEPTSGKINFDNLILLHEASLYCVFICLLILYEITLIKWVNPKTVSDLHYFLRVRKAKLMVIVESLPEIGGDQKLTDLLKSRLEKINV